MASLNDLISRVISEASSQNFEGAKLLQLHLDLQKSIQHLRDIQKRHPQSLFAQKFSELDAKIKSVAAKSVSSLYSELNEVSRCYEACWIEFSKTPALWDAPSPLFDALKDQGIDEIIVIEMIKKTPHINAVLTGGVTALHVAAENDRVEMLGPLLAQGAQLNQQCLLHGNTPLIAAARVPHARMIDALIQAGAEVGKKNNYGQTPLSIVEAMHQQALSRPRQDETRAVMETLKTALAQQKGTAAPLRASVPPQEAAKPTPPQAVPPAAGWANFSEIKGKKKMPAKL